MFCEKCGKPTEGEQTLCPECAAQQEVVLDEAPVPAEEPVQPVEVPQEPVPAEDTFELNLEGPSFEAKPPKKKKKDLIAAIVAVVAAAAIGVTGWLCWDYVEAFWQRTFTKPEDYLASVEKEAVSKYTADLTSAYGKWLSGSDAAASSGKATIGLTLGDDVISAAEASLQMQGADMDLDWLKNINLSVDANVDDTVMQAILSLGLGEQGIISVDTIMDMEDGIIYIAIPELNDQYLYVEFPEEDFQSAFASSMELSQELMENLPSEEEMNEMINRYVDIILAEIKNVSKSTKTVKVGDTSQKMVVLSAKITQEDLLDIAAAVLEEAEDDKTLEKVMDAFSAYGNMIGEQNSYGYYEPVDLHEEFIDSLPDLLDELETEKEYADKGNYVKLNVYVDMKNDVRGHELVVYSEGEKQDQDIYWLTAKKGNTVYTEAKFAEVEITGEETEKDGISNGELEFAVADRDLFTIEFKDVTETSGTYRFVPSEEMLEEILSDADLPTAFLSDNLSLELVCGTSSDPNYFALNILMGNKTVIGLDISAEPTSGGSISIPKNAFDANSQSAVMRWAQNLDFDNVLDALEDANIPDEIVEALVDSLAG